MGTSRATIALQQETLERAKENAKKRGFANSFSAYVAWLIERDSEGAVIREDVAPYSVTPKGIRGAKKPKE